MHGTTLGKYRIIGTLGRGATGIVYKAVDESLGREVAVKILNPSLAESRRSSVSGRKRRCWRA